MKLRTSRSLELIPIVMVLLSTCTFSFVWSMKIAMGKTEVGHKCVNEKTCTGLGGSAAPMGGCTPHGFLAPTDSGCGTSDDQAGVPKKCSWSITFDCPVQPNATCNGDDADEPYIASNCGPSCVYVEYNIASCACGDGGENTVESGSGRGCTSF